MKSVFLIGDSIRLGYCDFVKDELKGIANVVYPEDNCRYTQYTFVSLSSWVEPVDNPENVDIVHWNNGHWDAAHWNNDIKSLNTPEQYAEMLKRIYKQLKLFFPNAKIIFALTTPMNPDGSQGNNPRTTEEIRKYNDVAIDVMKKLNVPVNDLFTLMENASSSLYSDFCHFTNAGYKILADQVTKTIKEFL